MDRDVVVPVDCWRRDALPRMPNLLWATEEFRRTYAVAHSAATHGSFPALLSSHYYPEFYDGEDDIQEDCRATTLPRILTDQGFETAGFVARNPRVTQWASVFDTFWNGGDIEVSRTRTTASRLKRVLAFDPHVDPTELLRRGRDWYERTDGLRFLWLHLIDLHGPDYPGIGRASEAGLARSCLAQVRKPRYNHRLRESDLGRPIRELQSSAKRALRDLYQVCVRYVDDYVGTVFEFVDDDATVVLTGDHGHEFDHGLLKHARPYDECVTGPFLLRWTLDDRDIPSGPVKHVDIVPTIAEAVDAPRSVTEELVGEPLDVGGSPGPARLLMGAPQLSRLYIGCRTRDRKLIRRYDLTSNRLLGRELYDLRSDPCEVDDRYGDLDACPLADHVDELLDSVPVGLLTPKSPVPPDVADRLKELGYR